MRFRLYRNARHLRAEGIGESIRRRLSEFLREHRNAIVVSGLSAVVAGSLFAGQPSIVHADEITDTIPYIVNTFLKSLSPLKITEFTK